MTTRLDHEVHGGKWVYNPYTHRGDRILDFSYAGCKASEEPIPEIPAVMTLNPQPDTPAPGKNLEHAEGELAYPKESANTRAELRHLLYSRAERRRIYPEFRKPG